MLLLDRASITDCLYFRYYCFCFRDEFYMTEPAITPLYRIRVALAVHLNDVFDYMVSPEQFQQAIIGTRVEVPFRRQNMIGIIVEKIDASVAYTENYKLKNIKRLFDEPALLDAPTLALLKWSAQYYQYPIGEVILAALPNYLRQGRDYQILAQHWRITAVDAETTLSARATKQREVYQNLKLHKQGAAESVLNLAGISTAQLKQLQEKGVAESFIEPIDFSPQPMQLAQLPLEPNIEQDIAINAIQQRLGEYQGFLLDGITGSGKTEVYLQVIEKALQRGQQVLVLVPEIGLTPQTVARFKARFNTSIVLMHSGLNDGQRMQAWQQSQMGKASIVIGTRLAVFCPLPRLGLIILDEEHDLSFKQQETFRYHARDVALYRAFKQKCPVILGSATPSFESLALLQQQKLQHLTLRQRAGQAKPPSFQLLDLKVEPKQHGLATKLIHNVEQQLKKQQQVLIFINRRGYAPVFMCTSCGWQADCPNCDAHLTLHFQPIHQLQCHHCYYIQPVPKQCPKCNATEIKAIGNGTARVEETLKSLFPDYPILRVDRDTTSKVDSWQKIYQRAQETGPAIFLGTQMLAKGHHFPYVSLVTILDIDAGLLSADFRAPERTAQLILQVAGRAGRSQTTGHVLLQTYRPEHPLLQSLITKGYHEFALQALKERQVAQMPPFTHSALLRIESQNDRYNLEFLKLAAKYWSEFGACEVVFWGPVHAPMQKKAGFYRTHLLILCPSRQALQQQLPLWWQWLNQQSRRFQLRMALDVDPLEIG